MRERTLVVAKPDAYERRLTGEIISRLERAGLTLDQIRISTGEDPILESHYPRDSDWLCTIGSKTLADYERLGMQPVEKLGTDDPQVIGEIIRGWLVEFLKSGPLVPMVWSGNLAIETVRKLIGCTLPVLAAPGTIRGDFSTDSPDLANNERRPVRNMIHASADVEEAAREIRLWFPGLS